MLLFTLLYICRIKIPTHIILIQRDFPFNTIMSFILFARRNTLGDTSHQIYFSSHSCHQARSVRSTSERRWIGAMHNTIYLPSFPIRVFVWISNHTLCFLCSIETIDKQTEDVREINNRMGDVEHSALTIFASTGTSGRYDSHREENMSVRKDID